MTETYYICEFSTLDDPGTRGFSVSPGDGVTLDGFIVRRGGTVHAYLDKCPHTGVGLAWLPDQYLDLDGMYIECAMHGALFTLDAGYCVRGPCAGQSLTALDVEVIDDRVMVTGFPTGQ